MSENIFPPYGFSRGFYYMNDNSKNAYTEIINFSAYVRTVLFRVNFMIATFVQV